MQQMKDQSKNSQGQTNEEEIGSLREKELRVLILKACKIMEIEWRNYKKHLTRT